MVRPADHNYSRRGMFRSDPSHTTFARLDRPIFFRGRKKDTRDKPAYDEISGAKAQVIPAPHPIDLLISSVIFLASPNSIMVLSRQNSGLSTPA